MLKLMILLFCLIQLCLSVKFKKVNINQNGSYHLEDDMDISQAKILVSIKIKNHAYSLKTFLASLESLKCPNNNKKFDLWVIFDNCQDNSYDIFISWLNQARPIFDSIIMIDTKNDLKTKQNHPELGALYFSKNLKIRSLIYAIERNFTYLFFLTADNIITNPDTIELLIKKQKTIVAPLLTSSETQNSNFRIKLYEEDDYYRYYLPIYSRKNLGCFKINQVLDTFLIDLTDKSVKSLLENEFFGENDNDDLEISKLAELLKIKMYICNRDMYGYLPDKNKNLEESFTHLRIEHLLKGPNKTYNMPLKESEFIDKDLLPEKPKTKLGFDEIYVINLERRSDRLSRIESTLNDLGISFKLFKAIDGRSMNNEYIKNLGIKVIPDYKDPYNDRSLNYGEIGCFLSHYFIWKEMVKNNYNKVIIFEDDAKFVLNFKSILNNLLNSINENKLEWDLLYLGRKLMRNHLRDEYWIKEIKTYGDYGIVKPSYTHWTISYALTLSGAKKLLNPEPLKKLVPVDEYLPIMFDKQPNEYWSSFFPNRDLKAYAIQPSIIHPTHYTGEPSHISDTEQTNVIDTNLFEASLDELNNDLKIKIEL